MNALMEIDIPEETCYATKTSEKTHALKEVFERGEKYLNGYYGTNLKLKDITKQPRTHKEVFGKLLDKLSVHYDVNMHKLVTL